MFNDNPDIRELGSSIEYIIVQKQLEEKGFALVGTVKGGYVQAHRELSRKGDVVFVTAFKDHPFMPGQKLDEKLLGTYACFFREAIPDTEPVPDTVRSPTYSDSRKSVPAPTPASRAIPTPQTQSFNEDPWESDPDLMSPERYTCFGDDDRLYELATSEAKKETKVRTKALDSRIIQAIEQGETALSQRDYESARDFFAKACELYSQHPTGNPVIDARKDDFFRSLFLR